MSPVSAEPIWKASTRLADGREIVYFDETPGLDRVLARDTRPLPPRPPAQAGPAVPPGPPGSPAPAGPAALLRPPEQGLRRGPLAGAGAAIAAARQGRAFPPSAGQCPADPAGPGPPTWQRA